MTAIAMQVFALFLPDQKALTKPIMMGIVQQICLQTATASKKLKAISPLHRASLQCVW